MANDNEDHTLDFDGVPPEQLGRVLAWWMRGIDGAFSSAPDGDKIWGHVAALTAAMQLLKRLPGFDCDLVALRDLQARLEKLTVGQKQPILKLIDAIKTPGRAPESYTDHIRKARAVALVQFALDRGWSETDACTLVAKELARVGIKGRRGGAVSAGTVKTWRDSKIKGNDPVYKIAMATFAEFAPAALSTSAMKKLVRQLISRGEAIRH
jgi:hypothetical protein